MPRMSVTRDPHDALARSPEDEAEETAKAAETVRKQQEEDIKWLMAHAPGRRFVTRLIEQTGLFRTSFHTSGSVMACNEGRKQVGYFLQSELVSITPDAYLKLLKEFGNG